MKQHILTVMVIIKIRRHSHLMSGFGIPFHSLLYLLFLHQLQISKFSLRSPWVNFFLSSLQFFIKCSGIVSFVNLKIIAPKVCYSQYSFLYWLSLQVLLGNSMIEHHFCIHLALLLLDVVLNLYVSVITMRQNI